MYGRLVIFFLSLYRRPERMPNDAFLECAYAGIMFVVCPPNSSTCGILFCDRLPCIGPTTTESLRLSYLKSIVLSPNVLPEVCENGALPGFEIAVVPPQYVVYLEFLDFLPLALEPTRHARLRIERRAMPRTKAPERINTFFRLRFHSFCSFASFNLNLNPKSIFVAIASFSPLHQQFDSLNTLFMSSLAKSFIEVCHIRIAFPKRFWVFVHARIIQ